MGNRRFRPKAKAILRRYSVIFLRPLLQQTAMSRSNPIRAIAWKAVKAWIRNSFPTVDQISTVALESQLKSNTPPLLIDARKAEEYAISHLPKAVQAKNKPEAEALNIPKNQPIVVYCSIGYRSARLAQQLAASGYLTTNLEGSLFQWANEDRPLISAGKVTRRVHPYSPLWGQLLNSPLEKAYEQTDEKNNLPP